MAIWIKQGVMGSLSAKAQKGFGRVAMIYSNRKKDFFCTSIREGNHSAGSLHYIGDAFDFRRQGINKSDIKFALGEQFDVVMEKDHVHVEYDPK